ncbi:MAG: GNAT family N-acetyltransferase [Thermodesulfobacteriota bacterium]
MTLHIRPARPADLEQLTALLGLLFAIEADFHPDPERQRQGLALLIASPAACVLVAEAAGEVVGMATGQVTISTAEGGPALLVEDVVVAGTWRGKGLGKKLLARLEEWAAARGIRRLQLLADRDNQPALDFYQRLGWGNTALVCLRKRVSP